MAISSELETYLNGWELARVLGSGELHTGRDPDFDLLIKYFWITRGV
jgi:hypothetical protein